MLIGKIYGKRFRNGERLIRQEQIASSFLLAMTNALFEILIVTLNQLK
jgi:hypothetical protein